MSVSKMSVGHPVVGEMFLRHVKDFKFVTIGYRFLLEVAKSSPETISVVNRKHLFLGTRQRSEPPRRYRNSISGEVNGFLGV